MALGKQNTATPMVGFAMVPAELRGLDQWVMWRFKERGGRRTKVLFSITGRAASTDDPKSWTSFETASAAMEGGGYDGIGFVFTADDPFCGVDLDNAIDPATGTLKIWARELTEAPTPR